MADRDVFFMVSLDEAVSIMEAGVAAVSREDLLEDAGQGAPVSEDSKFDLIAYLAWLVSNG